MGVDRFHFESRLFRTFLQELFQDTHTRVPLPRLCSVRNAFLVGEGGGGGVFHRDGPMTDERETRRLYVSPLGRLWRKNTILGCRAATVDSNTASCHHASGQQHGKAQLTAMCKQHNDCVFGPQQACSVRFQNRSPPSRLTRAKLFLSIGKKPLPL